MTDDFQEQGLEPDDFEEEQEEDYVDSIGVLELLAGPGDFNGPVPDSSLFRHLILASRHPNLSSQGSPDW